MFSQIQTQLKARLNAASDAEKDYILPATTVELDEQEIYDARFNETREQLRVLYGSTRSWIGLGFQIEDALEQLISPLDTVLSSELQDHLLSAVSAAKSISHVAALQEASLSDKSDAALGGKVASVQDLLDALEAPLALLGNVHTQLSLPLQEATQKIEHPLIKLMLSDWTKVIKICKSIYQNPDFRAIYSDDDKIYKEIIAAEEFFQREYNKDSEPFYRRNCASSESRGDSLFKIRNDAGMKENWKLWVYSSTGQEVFDAMMFRPGAAESMQFMIDTKKARDWSFKLDTSFRVLDWTYPPQENYNMANGWMEREVGAKTAEWLKGRWKVAEKLAKEAAIWAAIVRRATVTSHLVSSCAKYIEMVEHSTCNIHRLSTQLADALKDLFYNICCEAPASVLKGNVKDLERLYDLFKIDCHLLQTYTDPFIDVRSWAGTAKLYETKKPEVSDRDRVIFGLSCIDAQPDHNIRLRSENNSERGPHPSSWVFLPFALDVDWLKLPEDGRGMEFGSIGWGGFGDSDKERNIGKRDLALTRNIVFNEEAQKEFLASGTEPKIVVWIQCLEMNSDSDYRIFADYENVTAHGFTLKVSTWLESELIGVRVGWLAYPANCKSLWSQLTSFTKKYRHTTPKKLGTMGWGEACNMPKTVDFGGKFQVPPRIIGLISSLAIDKAYATRVRAKAVKITKDCARLHGDSWDNTKAYSVGISFIARGVPT